MRGGFKYHKNHTFLSGGEMRLEVLCALTVLLLPRAPASVPAIGRMTPHPNQPAVRVSDDVAEV